MLQTLFSKKGARLHLDIDSRKYRDCEKKYGFTIPATALAQRQHTSAHLIKPVAI